MGVQGKEEIKCPCGNETFKLVRYFYGDNIACPGSTDMVIVCAACNKIYVTIMEGKQNESG